MKKIITLFFILLVITSCSKFKNDNKSGTGNINQNNNINNGTGVTGTGVTGTGATGTGEILGTGAIIKELTIEEKIEQLFSEKEAKSLLKINKNGDLDEEIPRIEGYYSNDAFYEFYILNSLKNNDINECSKIKLENEKVLCENIFNNIDNKEKVISLYNESGEDESFSIYMYETFKNIKNNNADCNNEKVLQYLMCKKIFNKNYDVKKSFLYYSRLDLSNQNFVSGNYKDIINYWDLDNGFSYLVEKNIIEHK